MEINQIEIGGIKAILVFKGYLFIVKLRLTTYFVRLGHIHLSPKSFSMPATTRNREKQVIFLLFCSNMLAMHYAAGIQTLMLMMVSLGVELQRAITSRSKQGIS